MDRYTKALQLIFNLLLCLTLTLAMVSCRLTQGHSGVMTEAGSNPASAQTIPKEPTFPAAPTYEVIGSGVSDLGAELSTTGEGYLEIVSQSSDTPRRFELLDLDIQTNLVTENPFDPAELEIRVEFTSPSGKTVDIGAFWYHEYDYDTRRFKGDPGWKARFTPTEIGEWTVVARIPAHNLESADQHFYVVESDLPGFVRVHPSNPRYFSFDGGDFFFPIGMNLAWWSGAGNALDDYRKWMDRFAQNGGNTIRVWMAEWSFAIEWNNTPLGDYSNRLQQAWLLDQIISMAEERNIYIVLVLLNCADFNNWQTNGWNGNPYNAAHGGPLETPDQFVTNPLARAFFQRRLNYIVNRWGYSPNILAWEWWNEVNLAPFSDEALIIWLQEMTAFLRDVDVNQHLITNSYAILDISPIWNLPELDIIQKHEYAHQVKNESKDLGDRVVADFARLAESAPPKPILLGEFGYGTEGYGTDIDKSGIHLHNGIWATTFAGYAGSGMYWYWDVYIERYNLWSHFRGLDRFLKGMDLSGYHPFSSPDLIDVSGGTGSAIVLGLRGDDILVWIRNNAYTTEAAEDVWTASGSPAYFRYHPPEIQGLELSLLGIGDGDYTVQWYDPQKGVWLDPVEVAASDGRLSIVVPEFCCDLAARIVNHE